MLSTVMYFIIACFRYIKWWLLTQRPSSTLEAFYGAVSSLPLEATILLSSLQQ